MAFELSQLSKVPRVKNPRYQRDGRRSYVWLLKKYNINPTVKGPFGFFEDTSSAGGSEGKARLVLMKKTASGGHTMVSAEDIQDDSEYLVQVGIGTPQQLMKLDFDTGSADLWVWSSELSSTLLSEAEKTGHVIFEASKSTTWKNDPGATWQIQYGDGSTASGNVGFDTLTVGGLTIENQAIERAVQLSTAFQQDSSDGLLGLAWGSINTVTPGPVQTPVENMITQQDIPQSAELFTACLGSWRDTNDPDHGASFYTFGWIDQELVNGQTINYTPVNNSQGFWQFESSSASVNGTIIQRSGNTAIADTGTTLALVSDEMCKAIYQQIPGATLDEEAQGWVFPQDTQASQLPTVEFAVGSKLFTVQKEDLAFSTAGSGMLYGGIQSRGNQNFDILGDVFLKSIYAIFDQGNQRFGCVQRMEATQSVE